MYHIDRRRKSGKLTGFGSTIARVRQNLRQKSLIQS